MLLGGLPNVDHVMQLDQDLRTEFRHKGKLDTYIELSVTSNAVSSWEDGEC